MLLVAQTGHFSSPRDQSGADEEYAEPAITLREAGEDGVDKWTIQANGDEYVS
jgi:hypothetical protein